MAKRNYTNIDLLKSIKLGCMVPVNQIALSDEDILFLASEELGLDVMSKILSAREEYYVYVEEIPKNTTNRYSIPSRATGARLRAVLLKDGNGNLYKANLTNVTQATLFQNSYTNSQWYPMFYIENDEIVFVNTLGQTIDVTTIQIHYYLDANELVLPERCLVISSIDTNTGMIEVDERQIPSSLYGSGTEIDFIQHNPSNKIKGMDVEIVSVSSNSPISSTKFIVIDPTDIPSDLAVGDFIALAGESPVPQLTANLRPLLAQCTICRILESQGDNNNISVAIKKRDDMVKGLLDLIQDRSEGNQKKVVNRTGVMRSSLIGGWRGGRKGS